MKVVYSARYHIDIGPHVFPTRKYPLVHARLLETGVIEASDVVEPAPASWEDLARVHTNEYLSKMRDGAMSPEEIAQLELPWSREMVDAFRVMVGGTIQAARIACGVESEVRSQKSEAGLQTSHFRLQRCLSHRRRTSPRVPESRRRLLSVQRRRRRRSRSAVARPRARRRSSTSMCTTATAPPSCSNPTRTSSRSRCTSSTTTRCGSRGARSTSACQTAREIHAFCANWNRPLPVVMASDPQCVFYLAGADPYEDDQLGGLRLTRDGLRAARSDGDRSGQRRGACRSSSRWPAAMRATSRTRSRFTWRRSKRPKARQHGTDLDMP